MSSRRPIEQTWWLPCFHHGSCFVGVLKEFDSKCILQVLTTVRAQDRQQDFERPDELRQASCKLLVVPELSF